VLLLKMWPAFEGDFLCEVLHPSGTRGAILLSTLEKVNP